MTQLNQPLRPTLLNKIMLFHDLDMGPEFNKMVEYNPVLSGSIFFELEKKQQVE